MGAKLELVREEKLYRLLPGKKKSCRLEASGIALVDDTHVMVVFDNMNQVAHIDLSLKPSDTNRLIPVLSLGTGFEDIAIDHEGKRVFCLIEALHDADGLLRGFVAEYDAGGHFMRCTPLATEFKSENKGFEGLTFVRRSDKEYLFALCEGNLGTTAKQGGARVEAFTRVVDGGWEPAYTILLPKSAEFEDYAAIAFCDGRLAVVSQESARVWTARVDADSRALVPDSDAVYRFPKKSYGNVEGITWLSDDTLIAVSDRKKSNQSERCAEKDQSIHIFRMV